MLPEAYRLKKRSAFKATYKTGTTFHIGGITMFCGKTKDNDYPTKIGFLLHLQNFWAKILIMSNQ